MFKCRSREIFFFMPPPAVTVSKLKSEYTLDVRFEFWELGKRTVLPISNRSSTGLAIELVAFQMRNEHRNHMVQLQHVIEIISVIG